MNDVKPAGSCKHRPTSNGWSTSTSHPAPRSWCGYCKAVVEHDGEWAAKYAAKSSAYP